MEIGNRKRLRGAEEREDSERGAKKKTDLLNHINVDPYWDKENNFDTFVGNVFDFPWLKEDTVFHQFEERLELEDMLLATYNNLDFAINNLEFYDIKCPDYDTLGDKELSLIRPHELEEVDWILNAMIDQPNST